SVHTQRCLAGQQSRQLLTRVLVSAPTHRLPAHRLASNSPRDSTMVQNSDQRRSAQTAWRPLAVADPPLEPHRGSIAGNSGSTLKRFYCPPRVRHRKSNDVLRGVIVSVPNPLKGIGLQTVLALGEAVTSGPAD